MKQFRNIQFIICLVISNVSMAQTVILQSALKDFFLKDDIEEGKVQVVKDKDDHFLKEGAYIVKMDEEGRRNEHLQLSFNVDASGKLQGALRSFNPDHDFVFAATFKEGIMQEYTKAAEGRVLEKGYFSNDTCYVKTFDEEDGSFKSERRYWNGEEVYSKAMNLSGWDLRDQANGIYMDYYGKSDKVRNRKQTKDLPAGIETTEESFAEDGHLQSKKIVFKDGSSKTINEDGSYEIMTPGKNGKPDTISNYTKTGKLIRTDNVVYPAAASPTRSE